MIYARVFDPRLNTTLAPAVFLDRDGTLTAYNGFVTQTNQAFLVDRAAGLINQFTAAGYCCVLVSNQSAIERGMASVEAVDAIHQTLVQELQVQGAQITAAYYCPSAPRGLDERVVEDADRKPGPGMLLRAARDLNLDLTRSWMVGDRVSDVLAGISAGCRGSIRVRSGYPYFDGVPEIHHPYQTADSLSEAVDLILAAGILKSNCEQ